MSVLGDTDYNGPVKSMDIRSGALRILHLRC